MSTPPTSAQTTARDQALYQATLQEVASAGAGLMGKLVEAARVVLQVQEAAMRDLREREALATAANQLRRHEPQLCSSYPKALLAAFASPVGSKKATALSVAEVQFDQLELMDDTQVQTSVTLARIQQTALQIADAGLAELNTLICSVQGLGAVRVEHNPLRPEVYIAALKEVVGQTQVPTATQLIWFNAMAAALGPELRAQYAQVCTSLRKQGVVSVSYAMPGGFSSQGGAVAQRKPGVPGAIVRSGAWSAGAGASQAAPSPRGAGQGQRAAAPAGRHDEALLTLDKLHRLLSGGLAPAPAHDRVEQFAAQFARQFENSAPASGPGPVTSFDATVPAALEALTEMKQVDRVVQSLEQRRGATGEQVEPEAHTVEGQRLELRRQARDVAQALSLEVVTLMVDNMAHDARLLEPVRQVIRNLEPPLSRLALVDPRFFTDKQHPARRLLQALTHRSMAFDSVTAPGFDVFIQELQGTLAPLFRAPIESAEVFEVRLALLQQHWNRTEQASEQQREAAVEVLQHAEARNLLAERIAHSIEAHPDSAKVAPVVIDFLCGPWAQVVAQARIKQGAGSAAAEKFEALVPALLWSAHPELALANPAKLTRLVPRLLATLREGLETIHYPGTRTSAFLEALMAIHQQVFRANSVVPALPELPPIPAMAPERARPVLDDDPWIAPQEALISNFVELQAIPAEVPATDAPLPALPALPGAAAELAAELPLGSWVEMLENGKWVRTQLTWASPHGTLFLFTGVFGNSHSMSRRSRDTLLASGRLRLLSGQTVDEGALDAVAQTAMRNSVDSVL